MEKKLGINYIVDGKKYAFDNEEQAEVFEKLYQGHLSIDVACACYPLITSGLGEDDITDLIGDSPKLEEIPGIIEKYRNALTIHDINQYPEGWCPLEEYDLDKEMDITYHMDRYIENYIKFSKKSDTVDNFRSKMTIQDYYMLRDAVLYEMSTIHKNNDVYSYNLKYYSSYEDSSSKVTAGEDEEPAGFIDFIEEDIES